MTDEQKQKYREAKKNYKITDEQKQKYREAKKDHQKEYRKNMTDEQKQKTKRLSKKIIEENIEKT